MKPVLAGLAALLFMSCETLAYQPYLLPTPTPPVTGETVRERIVYVEASLPDNPLLTSKTALKIGPYTLTAFERKALREIFGPPVVRWVEHHIRVGGEKDFTGDDQIAIAYYPLRSPRTTNATCTGFPLNGKD